VHIAALAALGVDGIFSDYPERVLAAQPPKAA
jgi:glycerophosphoryl diester phosphodiesterase